MNFTGVTMNNFDYIVLAIIIILSLKGLYKGVVHEILSIIAIIGSIFIASIFKRNLGEYIQNILSLNLGNRNTEALGFIIIVVVIVFIIYVISKIISSHMGLSKISRILGMIIDIIKVTLIISIILAIGSKIKTINKKIVESDTINKSLSYEHLLDIGNYILQIKKDDVLYNIGNVKDSVNNTIKGAKDSATKALDNTSKAINSDMKSVKKDKKSLDSSHNSSSLELDKNLDVSKL